MRKGNIHYDIRNIMMPRRIPADAMEALDCSDVTSVDGVCVVLVLVVVEVVDVVVVCFSSCSMIISMMSTAVYFVFPGKYEHTL